MSWAKVPTERPPKPKIGVEGFTLRMADAGAYAWVPDRWPYENDTPRGSCPRRTWACRRRTRSTKGRSAGPRTRPTSTSWRSRSSGSRRPRSPGRRSSRSPDHVEAAIDQIVSNFSEQQYNSNAVLMGSAEGDLLRVPRGEALPRRRRPSTTRATSRRSASARWPTAAGWACSPGVSSIAPLRVVQVHGTRRVHEHHPHVVSAGAMRDGSTRSAAHRPTVSSSN